MYDTYQEIFRKRADIYHQAMMEFPSVRRQEFEQAVRFLDIAPGDLVCDVPSGGGYLAPYVQTEDVSFIFLETSAEFASHCPVGPNCSVMECVLESLPLDDGSVDRLLSLAAVHHVPDKAALYREFCRVLKSSAKLVIVDVEVGTNTANFLNGFVDRFNSMGHRGMFLDAGGIEQVAQCGFDLVGIARPEITWSFESTAAMTGFFRKLFGLDKATDADILAGVAEHFPRKRQNGRVEIDWQLVYVSAQKP